MSTKEIKCIDCFWFKKSSNESSVMSSYMNGIIPGIVVRNSSIRMCMHDVCFEEKQKSNPVRGIFYVKKRICGQGILNSSNDCEYFKELTKWQRFKNWFELDIDRSMGYRGL